MTLSDIFANLNQQVLTYKKGGIHIKKSHRGLLRKHLGTKKGKKIPLSKLRIKKTDSKAIRKRKQFAINARKWHHK